MRNTLIIALAGAVVLTGLSGCSLVSSSFKTDLTASLEGSKPKLSDCYKQALTRNPKLAGTMAVKLTVARKSTAISDVSVVERPAQDEALDKCVVDAITGLTVPAAPKVKVLVEHPITLQPQP
jgi:hypothetical protein